MVLAIDEQFFVCFCPIYISELYKYVFCYSNRTWKAQNQTLCHMPTVWPDSSVVRPGRVMGGVNDTCEEKAYDQMGNRTQDLSQTVQIL